MNIVITNIQHLDLDKDLNKFIYFNPWGFSKSGIASQLSNALNGIEFHAEDVIVFCIRDLFYGRRSEIAFQRISERFRRNKIIKLSPEEMESFLNNSSV